jgi:hypothetical protein
LKLNDLEVRTIRMRDLNKGDRQNLGKLIAPRRLLP